MYTTPLKNKFGKEIKTYYLELYVTSIVIFEKIKIKVDIRQGKKFVKPIFEIDNIQP